MKTRLMALALILALLGGVTMARPMEVRGESTYTGWFLLFVEAGRLNTANNLARQWDPDPASTGGFGSLKLSPTGQEPATHYAMSTPATPTMSDGITNALSHLSWATMYSTTNILEENPVWTGPDGFTATGSAYEAFMAAAGDMGLQIIEVVP